MIVEWWRYLIDSQLHIIGLRRHCYRHYSMVKLILSHNVLGITVEYDLRSFYHWTIPTGRELFCYIFWEVDVDVDLGGEQTGEEFFYVRFYSSWVGSLIPRLKSDQVRVFSLFIFWLFTNWVERDVPLAKVDGRLDHANLVTGKPHQI